MLLLFSYVEAMLLTFAPKECEIFKLAAERLKINEFLIENFLSLLNILGLALLQTRSACPMYEPNSHFLRVFLI